MAGGQWLLDNKPEFWGSLSNLFLGFLVLISIIILNRSSNQWIRLSSIVLGLVIGFVVALFMGKVNTSAVFAVQEVISIPIPFRYGFDFDIIAFIPIALIYVITAIESSGDITANCMISKQDVKGEGYIERIKNGVLGDGINSALSLIHISAPTRPY